MTESLSPLLAGGPIAPATPPRRPRRRASWGLVALIAVTTAGAGALVATRWHRASGTAVAGAGGTAGMSAMPGMAAETSTRPAGAGTKAVYVSAARQQLVGVRTDAVARQHVEGTVRTVGMLAYDETRTVEIHTRVSGWVEQLFVDYVGKPVHRGQPLFSFYSPDLVTAQADYLVALRAHVLVAGGPIPEATTGADSLLAASRERLKRWAVTDAQISELEHAGQPSRTMTLAAPFDGVVLQKSAFAGQYLTPEMTSFKLADLSAVWVMGQMFEYEAAALHPGDAVDIELPYGDARTLAAHVDFVYPEVDPQTRRVRFRAILPNADRKLKPDTYVTIVWHGEAVDRLVVPKEAVIDTGERKYVLLALANGYFEPRDVRVGPPIAAIYPVLSGLVEGDRVVTSAQFLIDSETNLMAAMKNMAATMPGMEMGTEKPASAPLPAPAPAPSPVPKATPVPKAIPNPVPPDMPDMPGMRHDSDH